MAPLPIGVVVATLALTAEAQFRSGKGGGGGGKPPPGGGGRPPPGGGASARVFHIMSSGVSGLAEKNAAEPQADLNFIAGFGCKAYPDGVIEMAHVKVDKWGPYARCNHPPDSTKYKCEGSSELAGKDNNGRYSFPAKGQNKHWWESGTVRRTVQQVYGALGCSSAAYPIGYQCACVSSKKGNIQDFLKAFGQLDVEMDTNATVTLDNSTDVVV